MRIIVALALLAVAGSGPAFAGDVYKTVNEQGVTVYTDKPPYPGARPIGIRSQPTPAEPEADPGAAPDEGGAGAAPPEAAGGPQAEAEAQARAEQCRLARERSQTYANAQRLYEPLPNGGRRYLSDEELTRARDEARQAIERFCDE